MAQQIIIADSTQLTCFDECPVRWYYRYCEKISKSIIPRGEYEGSEESKIKQNTRDMGSIGHKMLEFRYKDKLNIRSCIEEAYEYYLESEGDIGITQNEAKLLDQTLLLYDAHYSINGDFLIKEPAAVEVGFSEYIYEDESYKFILEGRIDIAEAFIGSMKVSVDHKFQGRAHKLYSKCIQFRNYAMVLKCDLFVVNYIRFNKSIGKDTFVREVIPFSAAEHRSWKQEVIQLYTKMAEFKGMMEYWANDTTKILNDYKRRSSCPSQYGGLCEFTTLCDEPNQKALVGIKNMQYEHKEPFKPW